MLLLHNHQEFSLSHVLAHTMALKMETLPTMIVPLITAS